MKTFSVIWQIDIDAESAEQAAQIALDIQRDCASTATCFDVQEFNKPETMGTIDLDPPTRSNYIDFYCAN